MRIGLAQIDCLVGNIDANCEKIEKFGRLAKNEGCEIVVFPEMSDIGYDMSVISEKAQNWDGKPFQTLSNCAADNSISIICGLSEKYEDSIYNSIAVFDNSGQLISKYRKTHLFSPVKEDKTFKAGDEFSLVKLGGAQWGLSICYDLRFPEIYRSLTLSGAEILFNCSAWPLKRQLHWEQLMSARAIENQVFFIGVNRVGTDSGVPFGGRSKIIAPSGIEIASGTSHTEELISGHIDLAEIKKYRQKIPAIHSRRNDIYGDLKGN